MVPLGFSASRIQMSVEWLGVPEDTHCGWYLWTNQYADYVEEETKF